MTAAKPDIPALADELKDMATFYMERPCVPDGLPLALTDMSDRERKSVASMLLRATAALTTAVEIGRAMQRESDAKLCDEAAERSEPFEDEPSVGDSIRLQRRAVNRTRRHLAAAIRSSTPPLDLDALTERIAKLIADEDGNLALFDQGRNLLPGHGQGECDSCDGKRDNYRRTARAVLSALGIRARED